MEVLGTLGEPKSLEKSAPVGLTGRVNLDFEPRRQIIQSSHLQHYRKLIQLRTECDFQ